MLNEYQFGYAVMSRDLSGIGGEFTDIETCKKYCFNGDVVVERIPVTCGISISINFFPEISFRINMIRDLMIFQFLWMYISIRKNKRHKNGRIVYDSNEKI